MQGAKNARQKRCDVRSPTIVPVGMVTGWMRILLQCSDLFPLPLDGLFGGLRDSARVCSGLLVAVISSISKISFEMIRRRVDARVPLRVPA
jgi:hypothetical protein